MEGLTRTPIGPSDSGAAGLALGERWLAAERLQRDPFWMALAATLSLHVLLLALMIGRAPDRIGDNKGSLDGVAVELIDAADFDKRRSGTLSPGKDRVDGAPADGAAAPQPATEQPSPDIAPIPSTPPAPQQTQSEAKPEKPKDALKEQPKAKDRGKDVAKQASLDLLVSPIDPSISAPMKPSMDLEMKLPPPGSPGRAGSRGSAGAQDSAAEKYLDRRSKPAKAVFGELDAYTRSVNSAIERTKPVSPGVAGLVVVEFVISETGRLQDLRVTTSSGNPRLDDMVLLSVRKAQFQVPPVTATLRDRTFEVNYSYK